MAIVESLQALTSSVNYKFSNDFKTHFSSLQPKNFEQSLSLGMQTVFLGLSRDLAASNEEWIPVSEFVLA